MAIIKKKELRNMCWITSKKENSKGMIAKTDIPILKVLGRNGITPIMNSLRENPPF